MTTSPPRGREVEGAPCRLTLYWPDVHRGWWSRKARARAKGKQESFPRLVGYLYGRVVGADQHLLCVTHVGRDSSPSPTTAHQLLGLLTLAPEKGEVGAGSGELQEQEGPALGPAGQPTPPASWVHVVLLPRCHRVHIARYWRAGVPCPLAHQSIIYYQPPNTRALRYLSIQTLELDLLKAAAAAAATVPATMPPGPLTRRLMQSSVSLDTKAESSGVNTATTMEAVLDALNSSHDCTRPGHERRKPLNPLRRRARTMLRAILFATRLGLEWLIYLLGLPLFRGSPLTSFSSAAQQLDIRLQQLCFWPCQYAAWLHATDKIRPLPQAQYVGFYNVLWLMANDIIIGSSVRALLLEHHDAIARAFLAFLDAHAFGTLRGLLHWLMGSPGGLKLNKELAVFLGELFLWLLSAWGDVVHAAVGYLPLVLRLIAASGVLGLSMMIALSSDLFSLCTYHLTFFYSLASKLYHWEICCIHSLFTLFRGQRINPLRARVDAAEYELDQLLLGTLFFAFLIFLFPTIFVYYALFSVARVLVVGVEGVAEIALAILNHFPLFALMLRLKDPGRLPHGIEFCIRLQEPDCPEETHLQLRSVPISLAAIFYQYLHLWTQLQSHYLSLDVMRSLLTGRHVARMTRLDYPAMPERSVYTRDRAHVWEVVQAFC